MPLKVIYLRGFTAGDVQWGFTEVKKGGMGVKRRESLRGTQRGTVGVKKTTREIG